MQEGGGGFAEGEDAEGDEFEFGVGSGSRSGGVSECAGEVHKVVAAAACVVGDLEEDLVHEGGGYVGHC